MNTTKDYHINKSSILVSILLILSMLIFTACSTDTNKTSTNTDNMQYEVVDSQEMDSESGHNKPVENEYINSLDNRGDHQTSRIIKSEVKDLNAYDFTLSFAGDINFDESWPTMEYYNSTENGIYDCISPELIQMMNDADVMTLNNEFTYSNNGAPLDNKVYTFRAHPSRVDILKDLGVDAVTLANNHVYDYGEQSLLDTMDTLKAANVHYFGAGKNLEEATSPIYFEIQDKTIAYVAASRAEKYKMTPQATHDSPGILRCYDTELFVETIKEAKGNADYVIAYVHWGTENSYDLEDVQLSTSKEYLDAGADIIIGAHPHVLQGMEYYSGKPIVYSLGNFWFNHKTVDTMLLNIHFHGDDNEEFIDLEVVPAIQSEYITSLVTEPEEKERIYSFIEDISINIEIDKEGKVKEVD